MNKGVSTDIYVVGILLFDKLFIIF